MPFAVMLSGLTLLGLAVLGEGAVGPVPKRNAKARAEKKVDEIVNRNKPPKVVRRPRAWPEMVALYPERYDWKEEERVRKALDKLYQDTTAELWEELVRRADDRRYCVVVVSGQNEDAEVYDVGRVCWLLAYLRLTEGFRRHLPVDPHRGGRPLAVRIVTKRFAEWRKERVKKSLYQLQIEVCEAALSELAKVKDVPEKQKTLARKKIKAEITKLRRTKRPLFRKYDSFGEVFYTPKLAERIRKAVRSGSSETIDIIK
jgi:hypothetical protein